MSRQSPGYLDVPASKAAVQSRHAVPCTWSDSAHTMTGSRAVIESGIDRPVVAGLLLPGAPSSSCWTLTSAHERAKRLALSEAV